MKLKEDMIVGPFYLYADVTKFAVIKRETPSDTCEDHVLIELEGGERLWIWAEDIDESV